MRQFYDIAFTNWTLLLIDEPIFHAIDMENVIAHRDFDNFFILLKILQAESTLLLLYHEGFAFDNRIS